MPRSQRRLLGWLPDPEKKAGEKADYTADELLQVLAAPPASASNRQLIVSVLDQGALGSCVANAGMQAVRASHRRQGVASPLLGSRLMAYYLARATHHDTGRDTGTYLRAFFQVLNKFGFCPEELWPYENLRENFTRMPPTAALHASFDQRSPTIYRRIFSTGSQRILDVKRALGSGYLVTFGTEVGSDFVGGKFTGPVDVPPDSAGGHAMCLVGYDSSTFEIVNSWGEGWGQSGYASLTSAYIAWEKSRDFWIVESAPRYSR